MSSTGSSPLRMASVDEGLRLVMEASESGPISHLEVDPRGHLSLDGAPRAWLGRLHVAETLVGRWPLPNRDCSVMDGFAVRSADLETRAELRLAQAESAAGHPSAVPLERGHAVAISTGAVLPSGADMVVPVEDTEAMAGSLRIAEDARARARPGRFVRARGSDLASDAIVAQAGDRLTALRLAQLVAAGHHRIPVHRPPRVAILSTGDELVPPGTTPGPGQVVSTNGLMLAQLVVAAGGDVTFEDTVGDDPERTRTSFAQALEADLVLSSGGISVGAHDHVARACRELGVEFLFHKLRLRPGKPTTFGRRGPARVLALPGNPASSAVAFELFARPWIAAWLGAPTPLPTRHVLPLAEDFRPEATREHWVRMRVRSEDGRLVPLETQTSGDLSSLAGTHWLAKVPAGDQPLRAGTPVEAFRPLGAED